MPRFRPASWWHSNKAVLKHHKHRAQEADKGVRSAVFWASKEFGIISILNMKQFCWGPKLCLSCKNLKIEVFMTVQCLVKPYLGPFRNKKVGRWRLHCSLIIRFGENVDRTCDLNLIHTSLLKHSQPLKCLRKAPFLDRRPGICFNSGAGARAHARQWLRGSTCPHNEKEWSKPRKSRGLRPPVPWQGSRYQTWEAARLSKHRSKGGVC